MTLSEFKNKTTHLSPSASRAADIWEEWTKELEAMGRAEDTPELAKSSEDFLGEIYERMETVGWKYGPDIKGKVLELSLHRACLFPWELLLAGKEFSNGADFDEVFQCSLEGLLSDDLDEKYQATKQAMLAAENTGPIQN